MQRTPLGLLVLVSAMMPGCREHTLESTDHLNMSSAQLPGEYRILAEHLALEMKNSPDQFGEEQEMAAVLAEGHMAVMGLRSLHSDDEDISYVATQGVLAYSDALTRMERINSLPKPPGVGELMVESFIHGFYGNVFYSYVLGVDAEEKQKAIVEELGGLVAATQKADAAQMLLPEIARKYAADETDSDGRIIVNIDEAWGWIGPKDWLSLYNAGPALEDCTIQVDLVGGTGQSRKNVHFIRDWPSETWLYTRYEPAAGIPNHPDAGRTTVAAIQSATVSVLSPKLSTRVEYTYSGAEKDKDIQSWCSDLKFIGRYEPFEAGLVWNTERGAEFTLDGIPFIPECRVDVTFRDRAKSQTWFWDLDNWQKGQRKSFSTPAGELKFDPVHIDMAITFPGTDYQHNVTLAVSQ